MKFFDVGLKIILDSRGQETLEAEFKGDGFFVKASVPAGKSTGAHEVFVLEPKSALKKFEEIKPKILAVSESIESQENFDNFLISLDGTENKQNLGGNLILVLSLAFARLKARSENLELFDYIRFNAQLPNVGDQLLRPVFNVINGGAHAKNNLSFQEFQVISEFKDFGMALGLGQEFYRKLGEFLEKKFGRENVFLGDEAGFSAPFKNNEEAIEVLAELIAKYDYPLRIGLDVAASQFFQKSKINNGQESCYLVNDKKYSTGELKDFYSKIITAYNILSIEDPFEEEAFNDFAELTQNLEKNQGKNLIIADDLTSTNQKRLKTAVNKKSGNAILIKPNQIGTLTEVLKVVKFAYENNWQAIVSHRSGETMDDFIADLAVGIGAWGIKAGAPAKPERMAKYERLLKIFTNNLN